MDFITWFALLFAVIVCGLVYAFTSAMQRGQELEDQLRRGPVEPFNRGQKRS